MYRPLWLMLHTITNLDLANAFVDIDKKHMAVPRVYHDKYVFTVIY